MWTKKLCFVYQINNHHKSGVIYLALWGSIIVWPRIAIFSQKWSNLPSTMGINDFLAKSCNPFKLMCPSLLCHKSGDELSSVTCTWFWVILSFVLYKVQQSLPLPTNKEPLESLQFPSENLLSNYYLSRTLIAIKLWCNGGICLTFFRVNVHPKSVSTTMSPITKVSSTITREHLSLQSVVMRSSRIYYPFNI